MYQFIENLATRFFELLDEIEVWLKLKLGTVLGWFIAKIIKLYAYVLLGGGIIYLLSQIGIFILKPFTR